MTRLAGRSRTVFSRVLVCTLLVAVIASAPQASAEDPEVQRVQDHIAAGEFAPALRLAEQIQAPGARNQALTQIAAAQHGAGAGQAAVNTLRNIDDDRARAGAIDHILAQRLGTFPGGAGAGVFAPGGPQNRGRGGATTADFDAIIELMTKTIEPDSWDEVGGPGSVAEFETGVVVDAAGVMRQIKWEDAGEQLRQLRAQSAVAGKNREVRKAAPLRKVSLPRLEKAVQLELAAGGTPDEAMQVLAGITRVKYVMVFPATGDIVIAGPAGDWKKDREGRLVNAESGRPVLRLDDFVVCLRQMTSGPNSRFGCSITPRKAALARTKAFLIESAKTPLPKGNAAVRRWLEQVRSSMGRQDIDVYGVDPATRVSKILVEADYHMKLIGIGLEKGTAGVTSYLDSIRLKNGESPPGLDVLRWWFRLNYDAIHASQQRDVFEIRGQGVQVLSENEMLTKLGERVHTGKSDELNRMFAASFTREFKALAARYPVYAELQNIFDLALVSALLRDQKLPDKVSWHMTCFGDPSKYQVETGPAPREVESVINHRVVREGQIIASVSGGVRVDPSRYVRDEAIKSVGSGELISARRQSDPPKSDSGRWWWD